ncbi:MAG: signal peptidase I [Ruminococcus sp.]
MEKTKAKSSPLHIIKNTVFIVTFVVLVVVMIMTVTMRINGETPSIFGYSVFRVSSGSMEPELQIGDVILMRECEPMELKIGDIVTYKGVYGEMAGKAVTHRVVKEPFKNGDDYYIQTKGDASQVKDYDVNIKNVMGKLEMKLPFLSWLYGIFVTPFGLLIIIALIIAAFFNEIINFFRALAGDIPEENRESVQDIIERIQSENNSENPPQDNAENQNETNETLDK